jgi:TolB-like protein/Tfp pilus assembly protein PilF
MSILTELSRRKVLRVAAAYIVAAWVLMQAASLFEATLELPAWFDKVFFALLLLGFPVALLLSWAYDIRPDQPSHDASTTGARAAFAAILVALTVGGLAYIYISFRGDSEVQVTAETGPSIAVLPFADMSPDGDQAWFSDGIAEEILNVLARTEGLKVASRTASFRYRGEETDIKAAAADLNVNTILEGSVRSQGDQLRITAQLINAADGFHLWSDTYDRELDDIFTVQEEISESIATALFGELGIDALPARRFDGTTNVEAYSSYLKGKEEFNVYGLGDPTGAIAAFKRAVQLDPSFADAWAALARAERSQGIIEGRRPSTSEALNKALALDPDNASAIAQLARYNWGELRWRESEQLFLRAESLAPNDADIRHSFGFFLRSTGRTRRALDELLKAWELGRDTSGLVSAIVNTHADLGEFANARAFFEERMVEVGLQNMTGTEAYFVSLLADGMEAEAREFATLDLASTTLTRVRFFLDRLDGDPDAAKRLVAGTMARIEGYGRPRWGDIDNLIMAGEIEMARELVPQTQGYGWSIPARFIMHINEEIDPRYLPYRPNLLVLIDLFPGVPEAFMDIGIDVMARGREKGFFE